MKIFKKDLVDRVSSQTGLSKAETARIVSSVISEMTAALSKGDEIGLIGFGTFRIVSREKRRGRNPSTGEPMIIPAKKTIKFKSSDSLEDDLNKEVS